MAWMLSAGSSAPARRSVSAIRSAVPDGHRVAGTQKPRRDGGEMIQNGHPEGHVRSDHCRESARCNFNICQSLSRQARCAHEHRRAVFRGDADGAAGALVGGEVDDRIDGRAGAIRGFGVALQIDLSYKIEPRIVACERADSRTHATDGTVNGESNHGRFLLRGWRGATNSVKILSNVTR
jgi:hypothetical protein